MPHHWIRGRQRQASEDDQLDEEMKSNSISKWADVCTKDLLALNLA
jgi:hypothetical protein